VVIVVVMFTVVMSFFISVFVRVIMPLVVRMSVVVRVTLLAVRALLAVDVTRLSIMIVAVTFVVIRVETRSVHCYLRILFLLNILLYSTNLRFY